MNLSQPIKVTTPELDHDPKDVLNLDEFIALIKEEEVYWAPDQNNTRLMISRLRKIFYDQWGWNSELIKGAANVESRYITVMKDTPVEHGREAPRYKQLIYTPIYRLVTYSDNDRQYGNSRAGQVPFIYQNDHQELRLPDGNFCDIAHVLAGLDAINNKQVVTPLPGFLHFLYWLFPYADSNTDVVTWIGDIASSSADFLFDYLKNGDKDISEDDLQTVIDEDAPGSDMLGDIDPYVIAKHYDIGSSNGMSVTDIINDYYYGNNGYRENRFSTFCEIIGLKGWDGASFSNEKEWFAYYHKQLRNSICFVAFSQNEKSLRGIFIPLKVWLNGYQEVVRIDKLLKIFVEALKQCIKEQTT